MSNTCLSASPFLPKRFIFFWAFFIMVLAFFTIYKGEEKHVSCGKSNFQANFHYLLTHCLNRPGLCCEEKPWWVSLTPCSRGSTTVPAGAQPVSPRRKLPRQVSYLQGPDTLRPGLPLRHTGTLRFRPMKLLPSDWQVSMLVLTCKSRLPDGGGVVEWETRAPKMETACKFIHKLSHLNFQNATTNHFCVYLKKKVSAKETVYIQSVFPKRLPNSSLWAGSPHGPVVGEGPMSRFWAGPLPSTALSGEDRGSGCGAITTPCSVHPNKEHVHWGQRSRDTRLCQAQAHLSGYSTQPTPTPPSPPHSSCRFKCVPWTLMPSTTEATVLLISPYKD